MILLANIRNINMTSVAKGSTLERNSFLPVHYTSYSGAGISMDSLDIPHRFSFDLLLEHGYSGEQVAGGRHGDAHAPRHTPDAHAPVRWETNGCAGASPSLTAAT